MDALSTIDTWGARTAAAGVVRGGAAIGMRGAADVPLRWASVTKLLTGLAVLVAVEEGIVDLDDPAGPEGSTLRHLLSHASGLPPDEGPPLMAPERRRIYSNYGIELAAALVGERAGMAFDEYLRSAVTVPLELQGVLAGSPAWGFRGSLSDLLALARELLEPTLVAPETLAEATAVQFPGLDGVLPGWGRLEPNDWGLAFELRNGKSPHWTSGDNSARTFGHFGAAGTFLWVDPDLGAACGVLTDREFGEWALAAWPQLNDAVVEELAT